MPSYYWSGLLQILNLSPLADGQNTFIVRLDYPSTHDRLRVVYRGRLSANSNLGHIQLFHGYAENSQIIVPR